MAAFSAGDVPAATNSFMLGVCGADYRQVIDRSLGPSAHAHVLKESPFSFKDENTRMQWQLTAADAARSDNSSTGG